MSAYDVLPRWLLIALQIVALINILSWYALATHYYPIDTAAWWVTFVAFIVSAVAVVGAIAMLLTRAIMFRLQNRRRTR